MRCVVHDVQGDALMPKPRTLGVLRPAENVVQRRLLFHETTSYFVLLFYLLFAHFVVSAFSLFVDTLRPIGLDIPVLIHTQYVMQWYAGLGAWLS